MYSNGKITAPVSIRDVQQALGVSSTDLATLCESQNVNPWARWKPIACRPNGGRNLPQRLTLAQVKAENYGSEVTLDPWGADRSTEVVNWITDGGVKCRPFNPNPRNQFHRLTDFVAPSDAANAQTRGYDHNARPSGVTVRMNATDTYRLAELVPAAIRQNMIIEAGQQMRFMFPKDRLWLPTYFKTPESERSQYISLDNIDWLCPVDFITSNTYGDGDDEMTLGASTRRAVAIVKHQEGSAREWNALGWVYDMIDGNDHYLDLSDTNEERLNWNNDGTGPKIGELEGSFVFVELYTDSNIGGNFTALPIPGLTYEVNITRVDAGMAGVDITGTLYFFECRTAEHKLIAYVAPEETQQTGWTYKSYLRSKYDSLTINIGGETTNLLTQPDDYYNYYYEQDTTSEYYGWLRCDVEIETLETTTATQATITCIKKGYTQTGSKTISIHQG